MNARYKIKSITPDYYNHKQYNIRCNSLLLTILFSLLLIYSSNAETNELHLIINGKAIHSEEAIGYKYNEKNLGMGLQYENHQIDPDLIPFMTIGGFNDSNNNPSYYIGSGIIYRNTFKASNKTLHFDAGLTFFMLAKRTYSHDKKEHSLIPGALPMLSFGNQNAAINMIYIPYLDQLTQKIWFIQLKLNLYR